VQPGVEGAVIAQHRGDAARQVHEGDGHEQLPDQVLHRLELADGGELAQEGEAQRHGDELHRLLEHGGHKQAQPVAAPARRMRQNPQPQSDGRQRQQDVDEGQAQDHLHQQVEQKEAEDQVEQGDEHRQAHAARLHGGQKRKQGRPQQVAGGNVQRRGDELGGGVGHVDDQGAPPEGRRGGGEAQHQAGHHLPPA